MYPAGYPPGGATGPPPPLSLGGGAAGAPTSVGSASTSTTGPPPGGVPPRRPASSLASSFGVSLGNLGVDFSAGGILADEETRSDDETSRLQAQFGTSVVGLSAKEVLGMLQASSTHRVRGCSGGGGPGARKSASSIRVSGSFYQMQMILIDTRSLEDFEDHGRLPSAVHCEDAATLHKMLTGADDKKNSSGRGSAGPGAGATVLHPPAGEEATPNLSTTASSGSSPPLESPNDSTPIEQQGGSSSSSKANDGDWTLVDRPGGSSSANVDTSGAPPVEVKQGGLPPDHVGATAAVGSNVATAAGPRSSGSAEERSPSPGTMATQRKVHVCLTSKKLAYECAVQYQIPFVSYVRGGYRALHDAALANKQEMINHDPTKCFWCAPPWKQVLGGGCWVDVPRRVPQESSATSRIEYWWRGRWRTTYDIPSLGQQSVFFSHSLPGTTARLFPIPPLGKQSVHGWGNWLAGKLGGNEPTRSALSHDVTQWPIRNQEGQFRCQSGGVHAAVVTTRDNLLYLVIFIVIIHKPL